MINRMVKTLFFQETKPLFFEYWKKMKQVLTDVLLLDRFVKYFKYYINTAKPETWAAFGADPDFRNYLIFSVVVVVLFV